MEPGTAGVRAAGWRTSISDDHLTTHDDWRMVITMTTQSDILSGTANELGIDLEKALTRGQASKLLTGVANRVVTGYDGHNGNEMMIALAYTVGLTSRALA